MSDLRDKIRPGENLLWSQIMTSTPRKPSSPDTKRRNVRAATVFLAFYIFLLWKKGDLTVEYLRESLVYLYIGLACVLAAFIWRRVMTRKGWKMSFERDVYTNCVVTDQRVLLSNHHASGTPAIEIERAALLSASRDYENGSPALQLIMEQSAKPVVLIGSADFRSVEHIINSRLIQKRSP